MERIKKTIILLSLLSVVIFWGCSTTSDPQLIDNGDLNSALLSCVPYKNLQQITLQHSAGKQITFNITRESFQETEYFEPCTEIRYMNNVTTLIPDYPIFSINITLSNLYKEYNFIDISVGMDGFNVPLQPGYIEMEDSVVVNDTIYRDVLLLKSNYDPYIYKKDLYADSLFYNFEVGIIQIIMSNNEFYSLVN